MIDYEQLKEDIENGEVNDRNMVCEIGQQGWQVAILKWLSDIAAAVAALQTTVNSGLVVPQHDYEEFSYVGSTNNVDTVTYKTGGSGGTIVATETFTYVGSGASDDDNIASVTLTVV